MVLAFDTPITTNDQSIDRVLAAGLPILFVFLDGTAPAALEQAMNRLAREEAGNLLVVRVPLRDNPVAARRFEVSRSPTIVTVRKGQTLTKVEGASAPDLEKHAAYLLGKGPRPATASQPDDRGARQSARPGAAGTGHPPLSGPQIVTDSSFEQEVLRSRQPVLVDFWAPWCGPCRMTEPILEKLARDQAGVLKVAKINVDENPHTSQRYGVQSIPTMMVVKDGQIIDRWAGALPEPALLNRISPFIKR